MKKLRSIVLVISGLFVFMTWNSCKKGPEDPFFSIYSRRARVCADWQVTVFQVNFSDSIRRVLDSSAIVGACGNEIDKIVWTYDMEWSFDKDGGFQEKLTILKDTTIDIINNTLACPDYLGHDSTITLSLLSWNFTGGIGDTKNKEQLYLFDDETKTTTIFDIIELREKEMKLETVIVDPVTNGVSLRQYTLTKM